MMVTPESESLYDTGPIIDNRGTHETSGTRPLGEASRTRVSAASAGDGPTELEEKGNRDDDQGVDI
jgi:hypothetical protein